MSCPASVYCRACRLGVWTVTLSVFCLISCLLAASPVYAVDVRPLGDTSAPEFSGSDVPGYVPPMQWTYTDLLPAQEWERYARRPAAQLPLHPLYTPRGAYVPHGFAGSHDAVIPVSQADYHAPRPLGPDPAALPVLSLKRGSRAATPATPAPPPVRQPSMTSTSSTVKGQGVTPPTVARPNAPVVPSPVVASPSAPSVPGATATVPPSPTTAPAPYAAPASPTGPVSPASPAVATPGVPAVNTPTPAAVAGASAPSVPGVSTGANGANGSGGGSSVTGALQTNPDGTPSTGGAQNGLMAGPGELPRPKTNILTGPAESLVIPPAGISLTPNNGTGALTAPQVSK